LLHGWGAGAFRRGAWLRFIDPAVYEPRTKEAVGVVPSDTTWRFCRR
jgi:hypothetical protein